MISVYHGPVPLILLVYPSTLLSEHSCSSSILSLSSSLSSQGRSGSRPSSDSTGTCFCADTIEGAGHLIGIDEASAGSLTFVLSLQACPQCQEPAKKKSAHTVSTGCVMAALVIHFLQTTLNPKQGIPFFIGIATSLSLQFFSMETTVPCPSL
jgi:hypothetical protein